MLEKDYDRLLSCYPQLRLPISQGVSASEAYRDAVLRGRSVTTAPCVAFCAEDDLWEEKTFAGTIRIWRLDCRERFERAVQALAYRCEPKKIPGAVGAQYIGGLINWEKIREHRRLYMAAGGRDWSGEFQRFTRHKENYTDNLILLSSGYYSGLSPKETGLSPQAWNEASGVIRKYHELTHFIYRKCYPGDVAPVRDEVLADCVGICVAFGRYDAQLARKFLGIENGLAQPGARLRHYVPEEALPQTVKEAELWICGLAHVLDRVHDLGKRHTDFL